MVQLIWSESAINDLNSIGEYIALDSEYAAQKFVQELIQKASLLISHPEKGRPIPENIPENTPEITGKYFIRAIELSIEYIKRMLSLLQSPKKNII